MPAPVRDEECLSLSTLFKTGMKIPENGVGIVMIGTLRQIYLKISGLGSGLRLDRQ